MLAIALVLPFYEPPVVILIDWATFSFHVSKPAMLLASIAMMIIRVAAPIFLVRHQYQTGLGLTGRHRLALAPPLPDEVNRFATPAENNPRR